MKTLFTTLLAMGVLAFGSTASAYTISPGYINGTGCNTQTDPLTRVLIIDCWTGNVGGSEPYDEDNTAFSPSDVEAIIGLPTGSLNELAYKGEADGGADEGMFAAEYNTIWPDNDDPSAAQIRHDENSYDSINCPTCFLVVKDGSNDPIWYIFTLHAWDGEETLDLTGFWEGEGVQGSISHVAIYGNDTGRGLIPAVPIPPAVWLFGSGLIGLVGIARRKETTC